MSTTYDRAGIPGADEVQRMIDRNVPWVTAFIVAGVKALMKDGRPPLTAAESEAQKLQNLLNAPPQFWDALQAQDPEQAAALVASVIKARQKGKIPEEGPLADEVGPEDTELPQALPPQGPPAPLQVATSSDGSSGPGAESYTG